MIQTLIDNTGTFNGYDTVRNAGVSWFTPLETSSNGSRFPMGAKGLSRGRFLTGFTLIELTVVLFIIAVLLGLVVPRLMDLTRVELRSDAQRLSSTIRYVYSRAVFSKTAYYRIKFDFKKNEYWVEKCVPSLDTNTCEWGYDNDVLGKPEKLAHGIKFEDIIVGTDKIKDDATDVAIQVYPQGYMPYTIIHITDEKNDVYSLEVNPFTGRVVIYDKYLEPPKS